LTLGKESFQGKLFLLIRVVFVAAFHTLIPCVLSTNLLGLHAGNQYRQDSHYGAQFANWFNPALWADAVTLSADWRHLKTYRSRTGLLMLFMSS
jgi:hypothetical protein